MLINFADKTVVGLAAVPEELIAEMTSAFVCASLGIVPTVRHDDYIGSWLEVLREDDRAIVRAASRLGVEYCGSACSKTRHVELADRVDEDGCANYAAWALRQRSSTIARP
jgi:hypothetical protein